MTQHTDKELDLQAQDPAVAAIAPSDGDRRDDAGLATPVQDIDLKKAPAEGVETTTSGDGKMTRRSVQL